MPPKLNLLASYDDGNLDLSLSSIQEVPVKDIAALKKTVSSLDLSSNNIVSLPKTFATSLTRLVSLDLSNNQLESLPENFGLLLNLKRLDLDNNKLISLPLSFGNLKALRWLDLKRNPLMPKLAEVAGHCQDAKQCQEAARNVVITLRSMQELVNENLEKKKEKQQKKLEEAEENMKNHNKEIQQSKKKKKKLANAATININIATQTNGKTHAVADSDRSSLNGKTTHSVGLHSVPSHKAYQKPGFVKGVLNMIRTAVKLLVLTIMLAVVSGFLLSLIDEQLYNSVKQSVGSAVKGRVPREYVRAWDRGVVAVQQASITVGRTVVAVSVDWAGRLQEYAVALSSDQKVQQYLEGIQSGWHMLWIWLCETYTNLSVEVPRAFVAVKRVLLDTNTTDTS